MKNIDKRYYVMRNSAGEIVGRAFPVEDEGLSVWDEAEGSDFWKPDETLFPLIETKENLINHYGMSEDDFEEID